MGIRYNANLLTIEEDKVYSNGRYFLGLGSTDFLNIAFALIFFKGVSFIKYPTTLVAAEFAGSQQLSAWSAEGKERKERNSSFHIISILVSFLLPPHSFRLMPFSSSLLVLFSLSLFSPQTGFSASTCLDRPRSVLGSWVLLSLRPRQACGYLQEVTTTTNTHKTDKHKTTIHTNTTKHTYTTLRR